MVHVRSRTNRPAAACAHSVGNFVGERNHQSRMCRGCAGEKRVVDERVKSGKTKKKKQKTDEISAARTRIEFSPVKTTAGNGIVRPTERRARVKLLKKKRLRDDRFRRRKLKIKPRKVCIIIGGGGGGEKKREKNIDESARHDWRREFTVMLLKIEIIITQVGRGSAG